MPNVGTALKDWSATSASNIPAGTTAINQNLDDDLRELQAVVVRGLSHVGANIASSATTDLGAVEGLAHTITGTTTITSFGTVRAGLWKILIFSDVLQLTYHATSMKVTGGANLTTAAGDVAIVQSEGGGNWRFISYIRFSGTALSSTFIASGSGSVTRSVQDKLRDEPSNLGDFNTAANAWASGGVFSKTAGAAGNVWLWTRKFSGAISIGADGTLAGFSPRGFMFDAIEDTTVDVGSDFFVASQVRHRFGGSNAKGGRIAFYATGTLSAATHLANANRNYVGLQGSFYADAGDGGTNTGAGSSGAVFGGGSAVYLAAAATNLSHATAHEFNTFATAGASVKYQFGITIACANAQRGAGFDAAIGISGLADAITHAGYGVGILFSSANGAEPFYSGSTLIAANTGGSVTVSRGIDFSAYTITNELIKGQYSYISNSEFALGDSGGFSIIKSAGASTNASILIRSKGTGSVYIQNAAGSTDVARFDSNGAILFPNIPTSSAGLPAGAIWKNGTVLNIV